MVIQVLKALTNACRENCGRGHCRRIAAVAQIGHFLGLSYTEASSKSPPQLLQLLSLKGKDALAEAKLLVDTHTISAQAIARILAESYLKVTRQHIAQSSSLNSSYEVTA